jgi:histidyl-tRNA synthetase
MKKEFLSTEPYKGVRDFFPEDMAVQQYIFENWRKTAASFGYQEYTASILESAALYRAKGAANEEIINDQTYTFIDRGDREVTLRPEMTPTVARMIAKKQKELAFPVRWFSIPNVFRYERPQKGRLREHWQLNCDLFGSDTVAANVEMIALAYQIFIDFGATPDMFEVRLNDRAWLNKRFAEEGFTHEQSNQMLYLLDRSAKIDNFDEEAEKIAGKPFNLGLSDPDPESDLAKTKAGLEALGIKNVRFSLETVRGFNYYTGVIFEIFDISGENNRSLAGGGRYDDLTALFSSESVSGIGFGLGDVTMRDFLETHNLLPANLTNYIDVLVIPYEKEFESHALKVADSLRKEGKRVKVDLSRKRFSKVLASVAEDESINSIAVIGENEVNSGQFKIKYFDSELAETVHKI